MMTALHLLATIGAEKFHTLTWKARLEHNRLTKREFRRREKELMPPFVALKVLPPEPSMFQAEYPQEFENIYGANPPVPCPAGEARVRHAQDLIPRRDTRKGVSYEQVGYEPLSCRWLRGFINQFAQLPNGGGSPSNDLKIQMLGPQTSEQLALASSTSRDNLPPQTLAPSATRDDLPPAIAGPAIATEGSKAPEISAGVPPQGLPQAAARHGQRQTCKSESQK